MSRATSEKGSIVRKLESDLQKKAYSIQLNTSSMPSVENWLKAFKDADFVFTEGEQQFYAEKGFTNEPQRCPECRKARKAQRRNNNFNN